jgi:hypothetical protein
MTSATLPGAPAAMSPDERAALARAVLARAERRTGARSVLTAERPAVEPSRPAVAAPEPVPVPVHAAAPGPSHAALALVPAADEERTTVPRTSLLTSERPPLPVPPPLAGLLPDGLRRGATTVVSGSTSLLLELLAHACAGGAWAAAVGMPALGLLAAAQAGLALDRLALVPRPGLEAATVVAALVDGIDVVVVGPDAALVDADRRRLSARARDRGAVLVATTPWPGAGVVLDVESGRWTGLDEGDGWLRAHEVRVVRSGRGSAGQVDAVDLVLPLGAVVPQVVRDEDAGVAASAVEAPAASAVDVDEARALLAPEDEVPATAGRPAAAGGTTPDLRLVG